MMENHDASAVYNATNAPYLNNTLMTVYAHSTNYGDVLGSTIPSEPHYIWQEGGTNVYADRTFTSDASPSATNSTSSTAHVVTQLKTAANGRDWRAYQ